MRLSTAFFIAGAVTYVTVIFLLVLIGLENMVGVALILSVLGWFFFVRGSNLHDYEKEDNKKITEEYLNGLKTFGKEQDGTYCDRWQFSIIPIRNRKGDTEIVKWSFCLFDEVDGDNIRVKYVETVGELQAIYKAISDEELI